MLCIGLALAESVRSARSNTRIAEAALEGYAKFAAWSYREHLQESLRGAVREMLGAVNHGDGLHMGVLIPPAAELGHYLRWDQRCACHRPRAGPMPEFFLGFTLGTDTLGVGENQAPVSAEGWLVDPPRGARQRLPRVIPEADRRWLVDTMTLIARRTHPDWGFTVLVMPGAAGARLLAMTAMPTLSGDTILYGALYGAAALDSIVATVVDDRGLLPDAITAGRSNREVLSLEVSDPGGTPLLGIGVPTEWRRSSQSTLGPTYGALNVRVELRAALVDQLIIGGLPRSRLPLLLALLGLAAGLTALAVVQFRREGRFARERSQFVASVSHELRTPLAQIRLVVDTLRLGREPDPARKAAGLDLVDREVTRLQHMVEGLLNFGRGGHTAIAAARAPVDVGTEARAVVAEFTPLAAPRRARLEVVAEGALTARLGHGALRQVLLNLLDNAVKYGPEGQEVRVTVRMTPTGNVELAVSDEGPGIPAAERERIWTPFARGEGMDVQAVGGNGIGLTVVRDIVTAHGGRAWVDPEPARGARVVVEFPGGG